MEKSNCGFICKCGLCGKTDIENVALSELRLYCGYGSDYDGEVSQIDLCGSCADKIFVALSNENKRGDK